MNNINNGINERIGLITQDALRQLKQDITAELSSFESNKVSRSWKFKAIDPSNQNALVVWPTLCIALLYGCALYLSFCVSNFDKIDYFLPVEATILWMLVFLNLYLVFNEDRLSKNEIPRRIKHSLDELERAARECNWKESNYPHLCAPFSPCLTLQWTYRDGKVVNLPWALLVRGDIIVMRPGQESPARCESIEDARMVMLPRQIYQPFTTGRETFTAPRVTQPHKNRLFKLTETPYISNLKLTLDKALCRPVTVHNKQRHLVMIRCIETFALPVTMFIAFLAITTRHFYLDHLVGTSHWSKAFLLQIVATTLPLLPTVFPVVWTALNIYGMSKFKHLLQSSTRYPLNKSTSLSEGMSNPLLQRSVEDGLAASDSKLWKTFVNILLGRENFVTRSANIVQVLGSVTALCCVDKKGILSWPNPTAEKVFFLRNSSSISRSSSKTSFSDSASHISNGNNAESSHGDNFNKQYTSLNTINHLHPTTVAEVLDLTHDQNVPFQLEFDDQSWKNHISCLKPLGLAILVNTCNMDTQEHYSHFCAHLTCEATQSEDAVPVTNRRCLCELAKQIGFVEEAKSVYSLQNHLATFRHLQPDVIRRDTRFARSLHLSTRVKVPLPHMLGVIMKDQAGGLQLMTQGTADIILDSCIEYWNGQDLCVLSPSDRKKVQDFYQRSSLTAYCSAFAYRPLTRGVSPQLSNLFLELPADCRSLYPPSVSWNEPQPPLTNHYHSTDSLLFSDIKDEDVTDVEGCFDVQCNQVFIGMVTMQYQAQSDMVELIERLDRACIRFVHFSKENELRSRVFSEKMGLESGWNCHISLSSDTNRPASPATSQTFPTPSCSEKAWKSNQTNFDAKAPHTKATNERGDSCGEDGIIFAHSSLESSRQLSNSAPGAINLDHPTVKFDNETSHVRYNKRNDSVVSQNNATNQENPIEGCESQDSVLLGGWEEADGSPADGCRSLSCLTDSTDHSAPVNFDMRNRAKLPRGIDNIRPHIEQVDNVPLLVSLFTDCTANTACRMIAIMQEYNEVVCVMGSASNKDNMEIFMQADASVAVEPLYPVLCQKVPPYELPEKGVGPIDLARTLNSIPCSISMARDADVSLFSLVTMARHFMLCLWSSAQFWLSASCSLTLLQLLSILLVLPMILTVGQVLWLCVVVIPAISVSLVFSPVDPEVMTKATNKHQGIINLRMSLFVTWCYGYKFLPSIVIVLVSYITLLTNFCNQIVTSNNATECIMMYPVMKTVESYNSSNLQSAVQLDETGSNFSTDGVKDYTKMEWGSWGDVHIEGYIIAQQISFTLMSLLIITISISFVHREYSLWQKNVWSNKIWLTCVIILTSLQCIYSCLILFLPTSSGNIFHNSFLFQLTLPHIITTVMAPLFILSTNEFIKWQEIKANLRYQRRARLDFGTKLGMNSPF